MRAHAGTCRGAVVFERGIGRARYCSGKCRVAALRARRVRDGAPL